MRMGGDNTGISVKETNQHCCDMIEEGLVIQKVSGFFVTSLLALFLFCTHQPCLKLLNVAHSNKSA